MTKIMLVEDDNNLREIYEARLMAEGYDIVTARDGEEALAVAVKEKPELIISDVMMPKISGFDMLDILRSTPETKNAKVIMMTALSQAEDKERASKLGADRYLVKSQVTLEDVARVAREVLDGKSPAPATAEPASVDPPAAPAAVTPEQPAITTPVNEQPAAVVAVEQAMPTPATPPPAAPAEPVIAATPTVVPAEPAVAMPQPVAAAPVAVPIPVTAPIEPVTAAPVPTPTPAATIPTPSTTTPEPVAIPVDTTASDIDVSALASNTVTAINTATPQGVTEIEAPLPPIQPTNTADIEIEKPSAEVWSATSLDTPAATPAVQSETVTAAEAKVQAAPMQSIEDEEAAIAKQIESIIDKVPSEQPLATDTPAATPTPEAATTAPEPAVPEKPVAITPQTTPEAPQPKNPSQRVIQPLNDMTKPTAPDLAELAKQEEAKEAALAAAQASTPAAPPVQSAQGGIDPNSLAL